MQTTDIFTQITEKQTLCFKPYTMEVSVIIMDGWQHCAGQETDFFYGQA